MPFFSRFRVNARGFPSKTATDKCFVLAFVLNARANATPTRPPPTMATSTLDGGGGGGGLFLVVVVVVVVATARVLFFVPLSRVDVDDQHPPFKALSAASALL